jgi:thiol-disulfide isomerase/thioredoxin
MTIPEDEIPPTKHSSLTPDFSDAEPKRPKVVYWLGTIVVLAVALLILKSTLQNNKGTVHSDTAPLMEGSTIPDFTLTDLDGKKTQFSKGAPKLVLLNFWATWCEACMTEMPSLIRLRERYNPQGFEIYGINVDQNSKRAAEELRTKFGAKFPQFSDPGNVLSEFFSVQAIPFSIILTKDRVVQFTLAGDQDWDDPSVHVMIEDWLGILPGVRDEGLSVEE